MDPQSAHIAMIACLQTGRYADAADHAADLIGWVERGGFLPVEGTRAEYLAELYRITMYED